MKSRQESRGHNVLSVLNTHLQRARKVGDKIFCNLGSSKMLALYEKSWFVVAIHPTR